MADLVERVKKTISSFPFVQEILSACDTEYLIPGEVDNRWMSFRENIAKQEPSSNYESQEPSYKR